jgi:hypothetical protein
MIPLSPALSVGLGIVIVAAVLLVAAICARASSTCRRRT